MVDITEISAIVAALGVVVGVIYYVLDSRHQSRSRQMSALMNLAHASGDVSTAVEVQIPS